MTAVLAPVLTLRTSGRTLLQQAIAAIRRNNGALFYVPAKFAGAWTDSAGADPVNEVADVIGRMTDRTGGGAVATQATTANRPTVQINAQGRYVMRFDGSNDSLTTNITTGNEGWVCAGVTFGAADNVDETVFSSGASTTMAKGIWMRRAGETATNAWSVVVGGGIGWQFSSIVSVPLKAGPVVVEGGWTAISITSAVNGIDGPPSSPRGSATPPPHAAFIGAGTGPTRFFNGNMTALVYCQPLPSAADRAIIRKWIGSLQGQAL